MRRITVDPEQLQMLSSSYRRAAGDIRTIHERLGASVGSVQAAVAGQQAGFGEEWDRAGGLMQRITDQADTMANGLRVKARGFEQADYDAAGEIGRAFDSFRVATVHLPGAFDLAAALPDVPQAIAGRIASLAAQSMAGPPASAVVAGLGALVGVAAVTTRALTDGGPSEWREALRKAAADLTNTSSTSTPANPEGGPE